MIVTHPVYINPPTITIIKDTNTLSTEQSQVQMKELYEPTIIGNAQDFDDLNQTPIGPTQYIQHNNPDLGRVSVIPPQFECTTSNEAYLRNFTDVGLDLFVQELTLDNERVQNTTVTKKLKFKEPVTVHRAIQLAQSDPCVFISTKLPTNSKFIILDLDCNKWTGKKQFGYQFIRSLFSFYKWSNKKGPVPWVTETPRGFHLIFRRPKDPKFYIPKTRDVKLQIGLAVELINSGFVSVGGLLHQKLCGNNLKDIPELPMVLSPIPFRRKEVEYKSTTQKIPVGGRYNFLRDAVSVKQINHIDPLRFMHEFMCEGQITDSEFNYLST